ncbi:MAG: M42 family peptidase, partial [Planctomycetia bacterium]|nr:M42 family peptidase [Planctomycetia bacterium]
MRTSCSGSDDPDANERSPRSKVGGGFPRRNRETGAGKPSGPARPGPTFCVPAKTATLPHSDLPLQEPVPVEPSARDFLVHLLETPSPSGYEQPVQRLVREYLAGVADTLTTDSHGNVIGAKNPGAATRMLLAGHCDQIGLIVQYVDADGYISVQPIGGWDPMQLVGSRVCVWSASGPVPGVIARKPIHLLTEEERKVVPKMKDLWIDIGSADKADAEGVVRVGDPVTFELKFQPLRCGRASAVAMDDKIGLWVVLEAFRRASLAGPLPCALFVASTVQEEIGLRGAQTASYAVDPNVAIAVDVTHATDCPTIDKKSEGDIGLGKGPVVYRGPNMNPHVVDRLVEAGRVRGIPIQLAASGRATPTDANVLQTTRAG